MGLWSGEKLVWFRPWIGVFLLAFLLWRRVGKKMHNPPLWIYAPLGIVTGFLSLFVGATGPFLAPFFFRDDFAKEEVIATKAVCQSIGHFLKIPAFLVLGFPYAEHLFPLGIMVATVIVGTLIGKRVLHHLPRIWFVRLFETILFFIGIWLIIGSLFIH